MKWASERYTSQFSTVGFIIYNIYPFRQTIQTIAFFAALQEQFFLRGPFLLVVPLSTMKMWEREFANWAPHFNTVPRYFYV